MSFRPVVVFASLILVHLASQGVVLQKSGGDPAARAAAPLARPAIVGVAHIGLKTDKLEGAREFYGHVLGFQEPFTINKPTGGLMLTYFKVNDNQYIEVFPELKSLSEDRLSHIAFETADAQQLRLLS